MTYLALLRGINVAGKTKVEMPRLKAVFESLGCKNVSTYINSGNVIFEDERDKKELNLLIETALEKEFGLKLPVVIRDSKSIAELVKKIPSDWNNAEQRTEVMFLWDEVDKPEVIKDFVFDADKEHLAYYSGAVVWNIDRKYYKQGSGPRIIKSDFYKKMTGRNINTVRKLAELMSK